MYFCSIVFYFWSIYILYFAQLTDSRYFTSSYGSVGISYLNSQKFVGSFIDYATEETISFTLVNAGDNSYMVLNDESEGNSRTILSTVHIGYPYRLVSIKGEWILHHISTDSLFPMDSLANHSVSELTKVRKDFLFSASEKLVDSKMDHLAASSVNPTYFVNTLQQENLASFVKFSHGLAELGYTGVSYPILQKVHYLALKMKTYISNFDSIVSSEPLSLSANSCACNDSSSIPSEDDTCLGLCGWNCQCWCWVCGDCCIHLGCKAHDECCRYKMYSFKCLFPYNFSCGSYYYDCQNS